MQIVFMEAIPLEYPPNKLHFLRRTQHRFDWNQVAPLYAG